jgi:hypothetical protein
MNMKKKMCKGVRGLKRSISSPVVSTQKKMSRGKGLQGYSAGRIPYPFTGFTCKTIKYESEPIPTH